MLPVKEGISRANLEALKDVESYLLKKLMNVVECPVPVEDDVKVVGIKNPTTAVILGFSTDQVVRQLLNQSEKQVKYIVIIEPNIGVFKQTIQRKYIGDLVKNPMIDWFVGVPLGDLTTVLYKAFSEYDPHQGPRAAITQHPEVIPDPFVFAESGPGDDQLRNDLTQLVLNATSQCFLSMGCAPDSYSRWVQTAKNFETLKNAYNGRDLQDKFTSPVFVVGAGPSMEEFVKYAKEYDLENKSVIIAVDAALRRLLKEGIRPHIVIRCERKLTGIFEGVTKEDTKGILYAAYNWTDVEFFDLFEEKVMLYRGNGVCLWTGYSHLQVNGGVSSGNAALELAWLISKKKNNIYLTGIDLCFIDDKTHVGGTKVEFDINKSKKLWEEYVANDGQMRITIPVWKRCRQEFETGIIKYNRDKPVNVYNLSAKGLKIHGTTVQSWTNLKNQFKADVHAFKKLKKHLKPVPEAEKELFEVTKKESIDYLKQVHQSLKEVFNDVDDCFFNIVNEEQKLVKRARSFYTGIELFKLIKNYQESLVGLYENPARIIDAWKSKYFVDQMFSNLILDTVQIDVFKTENKAHSLRNTVDVKFERLKLYCQLYVDLYQTIDFYVEKMIELLEGENDNCRDVPEP